MSRRPYTRGEFAQRSIQLLEAIRTDMIGDETGGWRLSMAAARNNSSERHVRLWAKDHPEWAELLEIYGKRKK